MAFLTATAPAVAAQGSNAGVYVLVATLLLLLAAPMVFGFRPAERSARVAPRQLDPRLRAELDARWAIVESNFRAHPLLSLREAGRIVEELLQLRGVPSDGGELGERFRGAHLTIVEAEAGEAGDYRISQAMSDLRRLRERLLEEPAPQRSRAGRPEVG